MTFYSSEIRMVREANGGGMTDKVCKGLVLVMLFIGVILALWLRKWRKVNLMSAFPELSLVMIIGTARK